MEIYIIAGLVVVAFVFYIVYKIKYGRSNTTNTGRDDYEDDDDETENEYDWYLEEDLY